MLLSSIKNNKLNLLKAIFDIITEYEEYSNVSPELESEISDIITNIKDKKHVKKLKLIKTELETWIENYKD